MLERASRALGYFSVLLGLVQLVAPRRLLALVGIPPRGPRVVLTRVIGLREVGVGMPLAASGSTALVGARVLGDVVDLALMAAALRAHDSRRGPLRAATAAVAAISAVDMAVTIAGAARSATEVQEVRKAITIARPPSELYAYWRDLRNLPTFMAHLETVEVIDPQRSRWVARAPIGTVEWQAEITEDEADAVIAWRSVEPADVENHGRVTFRPAELGRGTEVLVEIGYRPPAGGIGASVARLFGEEPNQQVAEDLRRLKQVLETGEVTRSEATAAGERLRQHPARPREASPELDATPIGVGGAAAGAERVGRPIVEEVPA